MVTGKRAPISCGLGNHRPGRIERKQQMSAKGQNAQRRHRRRSLLTPRGQILCIGFSLAAAALVLGALLPSVLKFVVH